MLLGSITAVFFICWGPLIFYTILFEFKPEILPQRTVMASVGYTLSLLFGMLTPIANPVSVYFLTLYIKATTLCFLDTNLFSFKTVYFGGHIYEIKCFSRFSTDFSMILFKK
jgi:hypothetical protein